MNVLSHSIQQDITKKRIKSLFTADEMPEGLSGEEATKLTSIKFNAFADCLGLNPYNSDGIFQQKLYPISNESIEPILVLCPTSYQCMDGECQPRSLLMLTCANKVPKVTLIKGTKIFKNVSVLSALVLMGHCIHMVVTSLNALTFMGLSICHQPTGYFDSCD